MYCFICVISTAYKGLSQLPSLTRVDGSTHTAQWAPAGHIHASSTRLAPAATAAAAAVAARMITVSYTHLTLPTILRV